MTHLPGKLNHVNYHWSFKFRSWTQLQPASLFSTREFSSLLSASPEAGLDSGSEELGERPPSPRPLAGLWPSWAYSSRNPALCEGNPDFFPQQSSCPTSPQDFCGRFGPMVPQTNRSMGLRSGGGLQCLRGQRSVGTTQWPSRAPCFTLFFWGKGSDSFKVNKPKEGCRFFFSHNWAFEKTKVITKGTAWVRGHGLALQLCRFTAQSAFP